MKVFVRSACEENRRLVKIEKPILLKKERKIDKPLMFKFKIGEIIRKISSAIAEVMKFRSDDKANSFLNNITYSTSVLETNKMGEIPNLIKKLTDAYVNPKATNSIDTGDNWHLQ